MERDYLQEHVVTDEGEWLPPVREQVQVQVRYEEEIDCEGGATLEQGARESGCTICGHVQGQVGQDPEQPGLVKGVPAHSGGLEQNDL